METNSTVENNSDSEISDYSSSEESNNYDKSTDEEDNNDEEYKTDSSYDSDTSDINTDDFTETATENKLNSGSNYKLNSEWNLWYHHTKNVWRINGYKKIFTIKTIKDFWDLHNNIDKIGGINNQHFFLMRDDIEPTWEHPKNKNGGCWSFKVLAQDSFSLWLELAIYMIGENLISKSSNICGLSICLKNLSTSVIKIWNSDNNEKSIEMLPESIKNKFQFNILYKANIPEY